MTLMSCFHGFLGVCRVMAIKLFKTLFASGALSDCVSFLVIIIYYHYSIWEGKGQTI